VSPRFGHVGDADQPMPTRLNRQAARRLMGWLKPYRGVIALNILFTLILTAVGLLVPKLLKWTVDDAAGALKALQGLPEGEAASLRAGAWNTTVWHIAGFAVLFMASAVVRHFEIRRVTKFAQQFMYRMRQRFFHHLHELSLRYYDKVKAGQVIARGTTDLDALEQTVSWAPNHLVSATLTIVGATVFLLLEDRVMFLVIFPMLPVLAFLTRWFRKRATTAWRQVRRQTGRLTANVAESIAGARVIQAFAREQRNEEIFAGLTGELYETRIETDRVHARYMVVVRTLQVLAPAVVILFGAYRVATTADLPEPERVTAGSVVAFLAYVGMFFFPMEMLSDLYNNFLHALAAADRIIEVLDTKPKIVDRPGAWNPRRLDGAVEFDHVTFEYDPGVVVLRDVSLKVRPGETLALVGPTGAGKTTICRLIARFYEAQRGAVRIDDYDVRAITQRGLHRHTGIVLQENFLFTGTVMDNIRYGRPDATDAEVIECARRIGSHRAIEALPRGYQTEVGERGGSLSAGQRQLVCFTRAMLADPAILILDEATSSVDTQTELQVQEALARLTERRTCFIVAHRLSTVRKADRVLVVEGGCITEEGTHAELIARGGRYARMYEEFIRSE